MKSLFSLSFISLLVIMGACSKTPEETAAPAIDYSYFPTNVGHAVIYEVDSIVYNQVDSAGHGSNETIKHSFHFQIKEQIESTFNDASGRPSVRVERYKRLNDAGQWAFQWAFVQTLTQTTAERYENNKRVMVLTFPPSLSKSWPGNAFNEEDADWSFRYKKIDDPESYDGKEIPTLTVEQNNDTLNRIKHVYSVEKYAKNIGLVNKIFLMDSTLSTTIEPGETFQQTITGGNELYMKFKSFSN